MIHRSREIWLEFFKAFNKVSHKLLLSKLTHYGIDARVHRWKDVAALRLRCVICAQYPLQEKQDIRQNLLWVRFLKFVLSYIGPTAAWLTVCVTLRICLPHNQADENCSIISVMPVFIPVSEIIPFWVCGMFHSWICQHQNWAPENLVQLVITLFHFHLRYRDTDKASLIIAVKFFLFWIVCK